jgi:hypothetical protein
MGTPTGTPLTPDNPPRIYTDTSFLLNLVSISTPAGSATGTPADLADLEQRANAAGELWDRHFARQGAVAYCSPVVVQEFYWACGGALIWIYNAERALKASDPAYTPSELWQQINNSLAAAGDEKLLEDIAKCPRQKNASADLVKRFLKTACGIIGGHFRSLPLIVECDDWSTGSGLMEFETLLGLGCLKANDCTVALTAHRLGAAIYADDSEFSGAANFLRDKFRIEVVIQPRANAAAGETDR